MRIVHVTPAFYPAHVYGGPVQTVYHLCRYLARLGGEVRVLTTNANGADRVLDVETGRETEVAGTLRVHYSRRVLGHTVSVALLQRLVAYVRWAEIVHLTAAYSFPTIPTLVACRLVGRPVVWSPRGALQHWPGTRRTRVKRVWNGLCRMLAPDRLVIHCTSEEEAGASAKALGMQRTLVIPNGVEIPEGVEHRDGLGQFRALYLGRFHPKKGIENLLVAWRRLVGRHDRGGWVLTLAGTGEPAYVAQVRERVRELGLDGAVVLAGEAVDDKKEELFRNADLLVMPSYVENFGVVVAEALARAVPVIASRGAPWRRLEDVGCGLWVENTADSLESAIVTIRGMPLRAMGLKGREWMRREFSWENRARQMLSSYGKV